MENLVHTTSLENRLRLVLRLFVFLKEKKKNVFVVETPSCQYIPVPESSRFPPAPLSPLFLISFFSRLLVFGLFRHHPWNIMHSPAVAAQSKGFLRLLVRHGRSPVSTGVGCWRKGSCILGAP